MNAPAVELTPEGLAAALELEAQGADVRALVSQELIRHVQIGGSLAAYARKNNLYVHAFTDNEGGALIVVTNGHGKRDSFASARVWMSFRPALRRGGFARVRTVFVRDGDEVYDGKGVRAEIPDTATTPEAWIAFAESLVADEVQAFYKEHRDKIDQEARSARNSAMLGDA